MHRLMWRMQKACRRRKSFFEYPNAPKLSTAASLLDALDDGNDSAPTHRPCTLRRRWKSIFKQGGLADHGSGGDVFWAAFGLWDNCRSQIGWLAGHRQLRVCIRTHETTTLLDGGKRSRWWGVEASTSM